MMMRSSEKGLRRESQPPALQAHPFAPEVSSFKRAGLAALLAASAAVCTSLTMASWDSAEARGSHGARSHGSVGRASGGFFGHRAASGRHQGGYSGRHQGGYKAELHPVRQVAHRPDKIRRLNPGAGRAANKIQDELRPIRKVNKVQDELRPVRKVNEVQDELRPIRKFHRGPSNRLSGDEKEKFYRKLQRQHDEAEARAEINRRNLERQQEAERQREQAREQYEDAERRNRELFRGGGGGGTTSPGPTIRINPQP